LELSAFIPHDRPFTNQIAYNSLSKSVHLLENVCLKPFYSERLFIRLLLIPFTDMFHSVVQIDDDYPSGPAPWRTVADPFVSAPLPPLVPAASGSGRSAPKVETPIDETENNGTPNDASGAVPRIMSAAAAAAFDSPTEMDDDASLSGSKAAKRRLVTLDYTEEEKRAFELQAMSVEDKKRAIKALIEKIPTAKDELFAYPIDWPMVDPVIYFALFCML